MLNWCGGLFNCLSMENIIIRGAKEHNLKNINLTLPRNKLIVVTGLSGSGKSSLAFDTIYAEGQRRYTESLSAYARQFLEQLQKPDVESIEGLSPAIAIEQRNASGNPRSTVATQTEIYDYLRLLFARIGRVHCYQCGGQILRQSSQEIIERVMALAFGTEISILAPLIRGRKGEYKEIFNQIQKAGFVRYRADGKIYALPQKAKLEKYKIHNIEVIVDRIIIKPEIKNRLTDSIETALKVGKGIVIVSPLARYSVIPSTGKQGTCLPAGRNRQTDIVFNEQYACPKCGISYTEVEPRIFSFNSPYGACPECNGLGRRFEFDPELVIPDPDISVPPPPPPPHLDSNSDPDTLLKPKGKFGGQQRAWRDTSTKKDQYYLVTFTNGSKTIRKTIKARSWQGALNSAWGGREIKEPHKTVITLVNQ